MNEQQRPSTDSFPLFLTPDAQVGTVLPSHLFHKQMHILLDAGVSWDRLNPDLRAAFVFDYYLENARTISGHSRFMGNARSFYGGDPVRFLDWAMQAARNYNMLETLSIMRHVQDWMIENPKDAATQRGVSPNVAPALKPYDDALQAADTVDKTTWLTRLNTLPDAHAQALIDANDYEERYTYFPATNYVIEKTRLLASFDPVVVVEDDVFDAGVKAAVAADPVAKIARMVARLTVLKKALPLPVSCAALYFFSERAHLSSSENFRMGAAKARVPNQAEVLVTVPGKKVFIVEPGKRNHKVFEAEGDPDALLELSISFDPSPRSRPAQFLGFFNKKSRAERNFKKLAQKNTARKTRKLGEVPKTVGEEIVALNRRFHLLEALALWLEQANVTAIPTMWRLERIEKHRIEWRFEVENTCLTVVATASEVKINVEDTASIVYLYAKLSELRKSLEGRN